jgi:crotonobetainyl-CoA:carnitine CoA-transferase CaiB-like acyl-CoA transferase
MSDQVPHAFPLAGTRVLDFSRVLAGPFAGRMLSDLGAEVVKVEPPEGDVTRVFGRRINGIGGYFNQQNAGKRSLCVDLAADGATDLLRRMAGQADIVLENFRPGVMERFGLGWDDLRQVKPSLVMLSISGFGQVGPERDRASYAPIVHAETGLLARQAFVDGDRPTDITLSVADTVTGLHGLVATLAAYLHARQTGIGQHIDLAMVNAVVATDDYVHFVLEGAPVLSGGGRIFEATGGPIMLAGDEKWWWHQLSRRGGLADPTPEGADLETKIAARRGAIEAYLLSFPDRPSLIAALDGANLAWGNVRDHREVYDTQPSVAGRDILTDVDDRGGGRRRVTQSPYRFSAARAEVRGPAPYRGEHNRDVLRDWLGLGDDEVAALHQAGTLLREDRAPT